MRAIIACARERVKHIRPYLLGKSFSLHTDHGSLTWLRNFKEPKGQLARWITIVHRQGRSHGNADALSRRPCSQCGRSDHSLEHQQHSNMHNPQFPLDKAGEPMQQSVALIPLTNNNLTTISRESQLQDESIGVVLRAVESGHKLADDILRGLNPESRKLHEQWDLLQVKHGKLWRSFISPHGTTSHLQLIVPYSLRQKVLAELHDGPLGGHLGEDKMYSRLKQRFY